MAASVALLWWAGSACSEEVQLSGVTETLGEREVSYVREDGSATAGLEILDPVITTSTTKTFAQYVMDCHQGWDLKAVLEVRGFSFRYVDNAPCAGLVTYYDGRSYLLFKACGEIKKDVLQTLFRQAAGKLKIAETLKRQSHPNLY